jgi:hypothetical protein
MEGKEEVYDELIKGSIPFPSSPPRPNRTRFRARADGERTAVTAEKLYQAKKNAYRHYIH